MIEAVIEGDVLKANGLESKTSMGLARKLKESGEYDQPMEFYRNGVLQYTIKSLYWAAEHTIREEPLLQIRKFEKFNADFIV